MKVGDLVCYNAGGMKHKTLGLVVEFEDNKVHYGNRYKAVLIQWCVIGEYMPRREWRDLKWNPRHSIKPGEFVWHEIGDWLEVVK